MTKTTEPEERKWRPEILQELDRIYRNEPVPHEVLLSEIEALEDTSAVDGNADLGICLHGITDDGDCITCRTAGCSGGSACACRR